MTPQPKEKTLFIGGIADGQRLSVPVSMTQFVVSKAGAEIDELSREIIRSLYHRQSVTGGKDVYSVFVCKDLSMDEAMKAFIDNYHPTGNEPMKDADWHQVQQRTGVDIMDMTMTFMKNYQPGALGNLAVKDLMNAISQHCEAAFNVGRGIK